MGVAVYAFGTAMFGKDRTSQAPKGRFLPKAS